MTSRNIDRPISWYTADIHCYDYDIFSIEQLHKIRNSELVISHNLSDLRMKRIAKVLSGEIIADYTKHKAVFRVKVNLEDTPKFMDECADPIYRLNGESPSGVNRVLYAYIKT